MLKLELAHDIFLEDKVEAPIWLEISDCSYSETKFALTKNTRRKQSGKEAQKLFFWNFLV
jgi:hypothetical protein